jgi:hypothetical protein
MFDRRDCPESGLTIDEPNAQNGNSDQDDCAICNCYTAAMAIQTIEAPIGREDQTIQPASGRWDVDAAGAAVFYPFGRAFSGYRLTSAAAAQVRAGEEQYRQSSSKFAPAFGGLIGVGLLSLLASIFHEHPVAAVAGFYISTVGVIGAEALARFSGLRRTLQDGFVVPAQAASRQRLFRVLAGAALSLVVFWLILFLYGLQLSPLAGEHPTETWFYPGIAGYVVFVAVGFPLLLVVAVRFDTMAARSGPQRAMLFCVLFAVSLFGATRRQCWSIGSLVRNQPSSCPTMR